MISQMGKSQKKEYLISNQNEIADFTLGPSRVAWYIQHSLPSRLSVCTPTPIDEVNALQPTLFHVPDR